jgi:hypothetical protein
MRTQLEAAARGDTPRDLSPLPPHGRPLSRWFGHLGIVALVYLLGAAVMFFELPTSGFLSKAFTGARAWNERREFFAQPLPEKRVPRDISIRIDQPGQTCDGFTLCTFASLVDPSTQAFLLDMRGNVVHRWAIPFSAVWPHPPHLGRPAPDPEICFFGCHLYPNGDLLVVFHGGLQKLAKGCGLAKLDKDSHVLWKYAANVHHHVDVGADGTIYAVQHDIVTDLPEGLETVPVPALVDSLIVLSPEGKLLKGPIPLLEALRDSAYAPLLATLDRPPRPGEPPARWPSMHFPPEVYREDVLHTNFVQVLTPRLAPRFPAFQAGQVLVSLRNLGALAVLDPDQGVVRWAARGPWHLQHHGEFLDNGHLLVFDNLGAPAGSRVLEYDPQTQALPWSYLTRGSDAFRNEVRGYCQRLPNGNTLVVNSQGGELREVTPTQEVVWWCDFPAFLHVGRRYRAEQLSFLREAHRARP